MQPGDKPNPYKALLSSRKFLLTILDVLLAIAAHFAGEYASPTAQADLHFLTAALQPVFVALILSIAHEDASETKATIEKASAVEVAQVQADAGTLPPAL